MQQQHTSTLETATSAALYDLSMLEEMDDTEYLQEMLCIFLKESPKDILAIQEALLSGDIDTISKKAHKLKSSAGIIQAEKLKTLLEDIEITGKKGIAGHQLSQLVENATKEYNSVEKALENYMKILK